MLALAAIGALTCAEAAGQRDTTAVMFLVTAASHGAGGELVQALDAVNLPEPDRLLALIRALDLRLAECPAARFSASRPGRGSR